MRQFRFSLVAAGLLAAVVSVSGCSVGMALSGEENPDLAVCRVGAEKSDIEAQLGPPTTVRSLPDGGQSCTYDYEIGNEPSAGRAVAHGAMDFLTLGIWEVVGTPVEAVQGKRYQMTVSYDAEGRAQQISTVKVDD